MNNEGTIGALHPRGKTKQRMARMARAKCARHATTRRPAQAHAVTFAGAAIVAMVIAEPMSKVSGKSLQYPTCGKTYTWLLNRVFA